LSQRALVPVGRPRAQRSWLTALLPGPLRELGEELDRRLAALPTLLNEYGYDPFGFDPRYAEPWLLPAAFLYRYWFRVETHGVHHLPEGRLLLIGNHAGNTFAYDAGMVSMATLLEGEVPRLPRGMAEYYLPQLPFFNVFMQRLGSVVGTPENCAQLLERGEAILVFPEGQRGFVKPYRKRYQLQEFGLGFMRLALETDTPIVPVGIVGSEEQMPAFANVRWLGRWIGAPAFPLTPTFPWLGPLGFLPLPVKFRILFGEPMRFEGDSHEEDAEVAKKVERVKSAIRALIRRGLAARRGWFS
jgi:1-acyl-sn-glycerol-3-phosphate acyltransferase